MSNKIKATTKIKNPAALEIYVRKYGTNGALTLIQQKVWSDKTPKQYRDFFRKCLELLSSASDHPKLIAANAAYRESHELAPGL